MGLKREVAKRSFGLAFETTVGIVIYGFTVGIIVHQSATSIDFFSSLPLNWFGVFGHCLFYLNEMDVSSISILMGKLVDGSILHVCRSMSKLANIKV